MSNVRIRIVRDFGVLLVSSLLLILAGCGGSGSGSGSNLTPPSQTPTPPPTPSPGTTSQWTWVGGPNLVNRPGNYGTLGQPAAANLPTPRTQTTSWTDRSGNFWMFGGSQSPTQSSAILLNDLWRYSAGQWTWVSGSNSPNQNPVYGTLGTPATTNVPGARSGATGWTDAAGSLWLFGGLGIDVTGSSQYLSDLWKFGNGQWTWTGGSQTAAASGIYGSLGVAAPANMPGAREFAVTWADASGNLWLFGGIGYDSTGAIGDLNDLWKCSGGEWTWIGGSNLVNQAGAYGSLGSPAPGNFPGARREATGWTDASGTFWLFGGGTGQSLFMLNDLWRFSGGQWTWMGGSSTSGQAGVYGTQGTASVSNVPGARVLAVSWIDSAGNFWLFGGNGADSTGAVDYLNDLWKYHGGQWTWVSGSNSGHQPGKYGTQGVSGSSNTPGGRFASAGWPDSAGNLYLFGGDGYDSNGTLGFLNDLWKYQP